MTSLIASPWSAFLPAATVSDELIAASRFHPAISGLNPATLDAMRGWWPFLIMSMACYALLPRLLLWQASIFFYRREMRAAFTRLPGSARVLARMRAPLVKTQSEDKEHHDDAPLVSNVPGNPELLLLNWAGALTQNEVNLHAEFAAVLDRNIVNAGVGPLPDELERLRNRFDSSMQQIYVAVKSWEPPMADLADLLANFRNVQGCTIFLVPLNHRPVAAEKLVDWEGFARSLNFSMVDVHALSQQQAAK